MIIEYKNLISEFRINDLSFNEEEYYLEEEDNNAYNIGKLNIINRKSKILDKLNK